MLTKGSALNVGKGWAVASLFRKARENRLTKFYLKTVGAFLFAFLVTHPAFASGTAAFNQQVNDAALQQQQAKTSELEDKLATLTQQFAQNKLTTEQQLAKKDEEIQRLNDQLTKAPGSNQTTGQQTPPAGQNGTPLPGPVAAGQARPPEYTVTPAGTPAATGVNMGQGAAFYPGGSGQRMTGGLSTTKFSYESLKKKPTKLPWIPSGSFSDAIMIEGADANASVTGQQNTQPVTIRLLGNIQMPNNKEYSADGCFVVGEIWGDISSERGIVRTKSISCVLKNGKHVDMEFDGHVSYQGKGGVRGKPVTGQSRSMNIMHFPALFLVDPRNQNYRALSYGFMTQDDLSKRFLNVATGFKPNS